MAEENLESTIAKILYNQYDKETDSVTTVVNGVNLVLKASTRSRKSIFIKVFEKERTFSSIKSEAELCNLLYPLTLSAARLIPKSSGDYISAIYTNETSRFLLVYEKANGHQCTMNNSDIVGCGKSLAHLHTLNLPSVNIPVHSVESDLQKFSHVNLAKIANLEFIAHYNRLLTKADDALFSTGNAICHGDPRPRNAFSSKKGVAFIDFEYSCIASPCYDIGILLWNIMLIDPMSSAAKMNSRDLINTYNQKSSDNIHIKDILPYMLLRELWSVWFLIHYDLLSDELSHKVLKSSQLMFDFLVTEMSAYK